MRNYKQKASARFREDLWFLSIFFHIVVCTTKRGLSTSVECKHQSKRKIIIISKRESVYFSAGIGRTGTFIALDMLTFEGENRGSVDIFDCVAALRSQRCNMVQTKVGFRQRGINGH